ncbi:MAG: GAF domain-containing protein, partial [Magnetococcales bacterium]|nr:GAF domain-containing protein [Magnetococcales bacterium]
MQFFQKNKSTADSIVFVSSLLTIFLALTVFLGWHTHNVSLIQIHPNFVPMQYNTALGFILCGSGLMLLRFNRPKTASVFGIGALLVGGLTLVEYLANFDLGIDQIFLEHYITVKTSQPGRMAPNTALCFTLMGFGIISSWALTNKTKHSHVVGILGALVFALSVVALAGYQLKLETAYGWGNLTNMAIHTASGFVILGVGLVSLAWNRDTEKTNNFPNWFPMLAGIGTATITLALWHAHSAFHANTINLYDNISSHHAYDALLVFGIVLSCVITLSLHYNQIAQQRLLRLQQEEKITHRLLQTKNVINTILQSATEPHTLDNLLKITLDQILTNTCITTLNKGAVFLYDDVTDELRLRIQRGMEDPLLKTCARISKGDCLCGLVLETGKMVFADSNDSRHTRKYKGMKSHCHYCIPINSAGRLRGVLNIYLEEGHTRNKEEDEFLNTIANTLSGIIEHKQTEIEMAEKTVFINNILNSSP